MQNTASDESHRPAKRSRATRNNDDVSDEGSDDSPLLNTLLASIEALRISITCQGERMTEMTSAFARTATTLGNQAIEAKFTQLQITLPVDNTQNNNNNNNNSSIQTAIERPSDLLQKNNWLDTHWMYRVEQTGWPLYNYGCKRWPSYYSSYWGRSITITEPEECQRFRPKIMGWALWNDAPCIQAPTLRPRALMQIAIWNHCPWHLCPGHSFQLLIGTIAPGIYAPGMVTNPVILNAPGLDGT